MKHGKYECHNTDKKVSIWYYYVITTIIYIIQKSETNDINMNINPALCKIICEKQYNRLKFGNVKQNTTEQNRTEQKRTE